MRYGTETLHKLKHLTKYYLIAALLFLTFLFVRCHERAKKNDSNLRDQKPESIFGLYSYSLKGEYPHQCEIPTHTLRLKKDSTFVLKLFCFGDSLSTLKPTMETGTWTQENDSILKFTSSDKTTFEVEILYNGSLQIVSDKKDLYKPSFYRDTTLEKLF